MYCISIPIALLRNHDLTVSKCWRKHSILVFCWTTQGKHLNTSFAYKQWSPCLPPPSAHHLKLMKTWQENPLTKMIKKNWDFKNSTYPTWQWNIKWDDLGWLMCYRQTYQTSPGGNSQGQRGCWHQGPWEGFLHQRCYIFSCIGCIWPQKQTLAACLLLCCPIDCTVTCFDFFNFGRFVWWQLQEILDFIPANERLGKKISAMFKGHCRVPKKHRTRSAQLRQSSCNVGLQKLYGKHDYKTGN